VLLLVQEAVQNIRFGYAAAMGVILLVFMVVLTLIQRLLFGGSEAA